MSNPYNSWTYYRVLADGNSTALNTFATRLALDNTFPWSHVEASGSDLRFYDVTADEVVPFWIEKWDVVNGVGVVWFKPAVTNHVIRMYYGNPAAAAASSFSDVFVGGSDFSADFGDLSTASGGGGVVSRHAAPSGQGSVEAYRFFRKAEGTAPLPALNYCREMAILKDTDNNVVIEGGKYIAFFGDISSTGDRATVVRVDSSDGKSWANPSTVIANGEGGFDDWSAGQGCAIKFAADDYRLWYNCKSESGGAYKVALATSSDGVTWEKQGVVMDATGFTGALEVACPWIVVERNGTLLMTFEARKVDSKFYCWAAESTDGGTTWTPINAGGPILSPGTGWEAGHVANPKILYQPSGGVGSWIMQYNGGTSANPPVFSIGLATSTTANGPWTRYTNNPVVPGQAGTYGVETSGFARKADGTLLHYHQQFSGTYQSGRINWSEPILNGGALLKSSVAGDAAMIGRTLDGLSTWVVDLVWDQPYVYPFNGVQSDHPVLLLWDSAAMPAADSSVNTFGGRRMYLGEKPLWDPSASTPGAFFICYMNGSGTDYFLQANGSWSTSQYYFQADASRQRRVRFTCTATNYIMQVSYEDDGTVLATGTIAKSSVKAISAKPWITSGDPFTNTWYDSLFVKSLAVRGYAATEPAMSMAAELVNPSHAGRRKGMSLGWGVGL
jgi:hypothetical protein